MFVAGFEVCGACNPHIMPYSLTLIPERRTYIHEIEYIISHRIFLIKLDTQSTVTIFIQIFCLIEFFFRFVVEL